MTKWKFIIGGMHCDQCSEAIRKAVQGLDGVNDVSVAVGAAVVDFDPATVDKSTVMSAIRGAGTFEVSGFAPFP